ncbi:MAG TPA: carboxypeptidase-like regulatory domain-containing protein, partial [Terriglobia bacterium]|nr:carboxypeptidase-like regulatory domain-containing protein [Terriglobia bacterium]
MKACIRFSVMTVLLAVALGAAPGGALKAQSTFGSVRGRTTDQTGAALPQTHVVLHSLDENTDAVAVCDDDGNFAFENVKPGHYMLTASQEGFAKAIVEHLELAARQDLRVDVKLIVTAR